jgi:Ca-activated chloride channel family protein
MAMHAYHPEGINRVILCSDGVANVGVTGPDAILEEIRHYVEEGVTLTTIGFGMDNYNDILMEQLADNGDGFYAYVDDMREARRLFIDQITGTLQTIAMDAKVQVDFNRMCNTLSGRWFETTLVMSSSATPWMLVRSARASITALYEVKFTRSIREYRHCIMRWQDPDTRQVVELSRDFNTAS